MKTSEQIDKILPALAQVKSKLTGVVKDGKNSFFKSTYADLNSHLEAAEPLLQENGLVLFQPVNETSAGNIVSTRIYHVVSGQFIEASMKLIGENDMQKSGSAITYARRYTLGSLLGMKAVDDDAETSVGRGKTQEASFKAASASTTASSEAPATQTPATAKPSFRDRYKSKTPAKVEAPKAAVQDDL